MQQSNQTMALVGLNNICIKRSYQTNEHLRPSDVWLYAIGGGAIFPATSRREGAPDEENEPEAGTMGFQPPKISSP